VLRSLFYVVSATLLLGSGDDAAQIRAERLKQNAAIAAHDVRAIERTWEPDIAVTAGMGIAFQGADLYRKAFEDEFASFPDTKYERRPDVIQVSAVRPLAAERGTWSRRWTSKKGRGEMRGSYMAMWQKTNGTWRIRSELFVLLSCSGEGCPPPRAP
jgi:ketosteroid isomerase-like protein